MFILDKKSRAIPLIGGRRGVTTPHTYRIAVGSGTMQICLQVEAHMSFVGSAASVACVNREFVKITLIWLAPIKVQSR